MLSLCTTLHLALTELLLLSGCLLGCDLGFNSEHGILALGIGKPVLLLGYELLLLLGLDLLHEAAHLWILLHERDMLLNQDTLEVIFGLFSAFEDVITLLGLELILVEVPLDDAVSDCLQLQELLSELDELWVVLQ